MAIDSPSKSAVRAWTQLVHRSQQVLGSVERDLKSAGLPPLSWYDALPGMSNAFHAPTPGADRWSGSRNRAANC
jgi:hypothetical protein